MEESPEPSKQKVKPKKKAPEDLQAIQADVASFAASLGLSQASSAPGNISSGFDDSDFRKTGPIRKSDQNTDDEKLGKVSGKEKKKGRKDSDSEKNRAEVEDFADKSEQRRKRKEDPSGKSEETRKGKKDSSKNLSQNEDDPGKSDGRRKGKKDSSKIRAENEDLSGKSEEKSLKGRKSSQPEPGSSKIHEVFASAIAGDELTVTKKRKGNWNDQSEDPQAKRSVVAGGDGELSSVQKLRQEAQQLMEKTAQEYERSRHKDSDQQWLMTARRSGTSADKVAAMTVILQDNPKANVRTLDALIGMLTSKAGKRHAATGIDALKELFMFNLLPDRKLKFFSQQPVATLSETRERASVLVDWYWEDCLKERYEKFVLALEEATKDTLFFLKEKALKTVYELLKSKPEQERRLLAALVNKLGDPDRKMASNSSYLLSNLLTAHPNMKKVVVDEVEAFVFRSRVGLRARYYAAIFLNQIVLSNKGDGPALAKRLVDLYFSLFKAVTSVVDEEDLGKKKKGDFGKKKGFEKVKEKEKEKERSSDFTMEIDSRLLSALLTGVNRALPYIKAEDLDTVTQDNSVLFRLVHSTNFNVAVQALMLLHQLLTKNQAVSDRFYRALYSVLLSKGLVQSTKAEMFLGLVFKALKSDVDSRRISAFAKRLTQISLHQPPQFACGSLLLLSEILKARPGLWNLVLQPEDNDDEEEHFADVHDATEVADGSDGKVLDYVNGSKDLSETDSSWPKKGSYDPKLRDPLYCNAHRSCWWELVVLAGHVHPSVAAMARTLLAGANIVYNGDPLRDLALGAFLDRFTEKKPKARKSKQSGTWHGSSLTLPSKMAGSGAVRPVGEEFLLLAEDQVAPEDVVFHKFYVTKSSKRALKKKRKSHDNEDDVTGEFLASDVLDGDDSEDEEVDAILEQEADLEMDGGEESEDEDSGDGEMSVNEDDIEDGSDGSEIEAFDDSDDEEAEALLEAGLTMSSDEDDDEKANKKNILGTKRKRGNKQSTEKQSDDDEADALLEAGLAMSSDEDDAEKAYRKNIVGKKKKRGKKQTNEKQSDDDEADALGQAGLAMSSDHEKANPKNIVGKKTQRGKNQSGGKSIGEEGIVQTGKRRKKSTGSEDEILGTNVTSKKAIGVSDVKSLGSRKKGRKASVFQEAPSDSE